MAIRYQRCIRIAPGVRLNLSKRGVGVSAGIPGLRAGIDSRGRPYGSAGIPGTGLSVRERGKPVSGAANSTAIAFAVAFAVTLVVVLVLAGIFAR